jgi:hypothetical protein
VNGLTKLAAYIPTKWGADSHKINWCRVGANKIERKNLVQLGGLCRPHVFSLGTNVQCAMRDNQTILVIVYTCFMLHLGEYKR